MAKMSRVVHFEMGYKDKERMIKFYETAFGWKTQQMGPEMSNYVVAYTGESDESTGRPKEPGFINGGFYQKTDDPSSHAPSVVASVDDIHAAMKAVQDAGGTIAGSKDAQGNQTMEPVDIPGVGLWVSVIDTEGNRISLLQPHQM